MPRSDSIRRSRNLDRRAEQARAGLAACNLCEHRCGVNRLSGETAPCGLRDETWCFKRHISLAEEAELLPSYMVYLGGCNFRCRFCIQAPRCLAPEGGLRIDAASAATEFEDVVSDGARTINLLGGEPSLHLPTILAIAAAAGRQLPLALNSNMYMTPEVLTLLEGVVEVFIADFKFGNDDCARRLAGVDRYMEVVGRNLLIASEQGGLIIRHLLMPGHVECCLRPVAEWVASHLPRTRFTLMTGYVPPGGGDDRAPMTTVSLAERESARQVLRDLSLDWSC